MSDSFYTKTASNLSDVASASTSRTNLGLGTAATQASSAFDAAGAATAAQAAAIAASLPTLTANVTATSSAPLATNTVTEVSAGSNLTMTLPTSVAGALIVAEKSDSSTNTVTISGNIRGVGSSTMTLKLQNESMEFLGYAGSWWPIAGHKTLGSLDNRYGHVFFPLAYGAKGDGTTDDTAALQNCAAASVAAKGVMDLGTYTFKTSSPITVATYFHLRGAGYGGGTITNSASDLFTLTGTITSVIIENCTLTGAGSGTGGGHIFNASTAPSMAFWKILGVSATQNSTSHAIWYQVGGGFIDCLIDQQCFFIGSGSATISPWTVLNTPGAWNSVKFSRMRCLSNGASVPFFNFDPGYNAHTDTSVGMTAGSTAVTDASAVAWDATPGFYVYSANFPGGSSLITAVTSSPVGYTVATPATATLSGQTVTVGSKGWIEEIVFDHITWEVCTGGSIWMTACADVAINFCAHWDTTATADIYHFATSASGYMCQNIQVRGGRAGVVTGGAHDFFADSSCCSILIDSFGSWFTPPVISSPAAQTTIINPTTSGTAPLTSLPGGVAPAGMTGATAASRYAGATASGHPATGTYAVGDFVIDQTGSTWICTTAGTPGTWAGSLASPALTGTPTAPTATALTNSTQLATTAYADAAVAVETSRAETAEALLTASSVKAYAQAGIILDMGYAGATSNWLSGPSYTVPATGTWTAGVLYLTRICCVASKTVNGYVSLVWVHAASMANSYIALYNSAGTRLGVTADLSSQATNIIRVACTGFTTTPSDGIIYAGYLNGTSGVAGGPVYITTQWNQIQPGTASSPQSAVNNLWPVLSSGSGQTAAPSTVTYSSCLIRGSAPSILLD